ncbi:sugar ABC transporter ATP-binding protein [Bauldia litoralis]|uniref:Ribose transport system ATP-binding protein n=1 Tax=Bauldia litoralis TaxID=665467 RepID=A0A1G6E6P7_9HYPH|nr:sugar ABC transporter ATP-binding protein [Bauldia litoralis]SDB53032.1 ribose transport system ATP-binding protein [Bauldia litoralis]
MKAPGANAPHTGEEGNSPLLVMKGIHKSFGENEVLKDIDFDLRAGEVHALLGENGAGKSTLMKILVGVHRPDAGEVLVAGVDVTDQSVQSKLGRGIAMIFQELSLLPNLTVAENLLIGREPRRPGWRINVRELRRQSQELLDTYDFPIQAGARVETLGFAQRQMIEIVKALASGARILVMDEPTSSLTVREEDKLFSIIDTLKARGIGIIYISHRMSEIFKISDRISVIKDGQLLPTQQTGQTDTRQIAEMMSRGGKAIDWDPVAIPTIAPDGFPALRVAGLRTGRKLRTGVDLTIAKGEIVGLAGLVGSGRSTFAKALFGLLPDAVGTVEVDGRPVKPGSPARAIAAGIGFVPEDRRGEGLVVDHGLAINMALPTLKKLRVGNGRFPMVLPNSADSLFSYMRDQLKIVCRSGRQRASELSGGNQQKVVVAKWLATDAQLLILDEPTSGVDVNAKEEMRLIVREAASKGMGVLLIASEMEELSRVADRIITMVDGSLGRTLPGGASETELRAALQADIDAKRKEAA